MEVFEHTNDVKGLAEILVTQLWKGLLKLQSITCFAVWIGGAEEGAHGAYCTLNPFSCSARGTQLAAKRFAAAAKAANLEHVIWSTFAPYTSTWKPVLFKFVLCNLIATNSARLSRKTHAL